MNSLDWDISIQKFLWFLLGIIVLFGLLITAARADKVVTFTDPQLEAAIRDTLDKPVKPLFQSDLNKITYLDASGKNIENLGGIEHLSTLVVLDLSGNLIKDITPLKALRHLSELNLSRNDITDLNELNFNVLANIPIKVLNLEENQIDNLTSLQSLVNLHELDLRGNRIIDVSPLGNLKLLVELDLRDNNITDIKLLSALYELEYLNLHSNNNISSVLPLENLTRLESLILENVSLGEDVHILSNMEHLTRLNIANSKVSDISSVHNLTGLTYLNLGGNDITDLSFLSSLTNLEYLNIHSNLRIQSVIPLEKLTRLETLIMTNVPIGSDIHALREMKNLKYLNIRNCGVTSTNVLGDLMKAGALQDNYDRNSRAYIDLRDNPISLESTDLYAPIRPYWENNKQRDPFKLPNYYTLPPPVFSHSGGYYDHPLELALETERKDARIFYTIDGSDPTKNDLLYDTPITIQSRRGEDAVLAWNEEMSPRWVPPNGEVFKATVIRAKVFDEGGNNSSPTVTHTFIVDEAKRYTLPVVSIATNPDYFFDYDYGIYVMGRVYDELFIPNPDMNPWERAANYKLFGEEWERPIHIEFFEANGDLGFSQDAGVRIQGTTSREHAQKSLRISAQDVDGLNEAINYEIFPGLTNLITGKPVDSFKTILLRNSGSDWGYSLFRDALMQSLVSHTLINTQAQRPVIVLLNGEYWGIYNLRERVDEYYLASYYDMGLNDVVLLSNNGQINAGLPGDEQHYLNMLSFIRGNDIADEDNYAYVQTLMDVENYIDYQVAEIYFNNTDWPHANIKYWRKNIEEYNPDAPYGHDGRWRWILYDTDSGFGRAEKEGALEFEQNNLMNATQPKSEWAGELLSSLLKNPEFRVSFINRFADHLNTSFVPSRVIDQINQMQTIREPEIEETLLRWRGSNASVDQWHGEIDVMRDFAEYRPRYVRQHIVDYFDLSGIANVSLFTDANMGYIVINSIAITYDTLGIENPTFWSGVYFRDVPITITAIPQPGYRFLRWEGYHGIDPTLDTITITLKNDLSLRAVFEKVE
jgi:Leucine-rich repeat (LRR) protein